MVDLLDKKTTAGKAHSAAALSGLATLGTLALALLTGQVDVPPTAEISGAAGAIIAAGAAAVTAWAGAYIKKNFAK